MQRTSKEDVWGGLQKIDSGKFETDVKINLAFDFH